MFFLIALVTGSNLHAQTPTPKTLLWRISGKELKEPSYLFGTMHLSDKRLFNFTDSVYKAIETSAGLAIEINPDEMALYYANKVFEDIENRKKVRDLLDDQEYQKYSKKLSKRFKKSADKITTSDIVSDKNRWVSDYMEKGEMPTFVDAYLYNIARRQGKWLGGIEDLADQMDLMDESVDKSDIENLFIEEEAVADKKAKAMMEQMINIYSNQDLDAINLMTNGGDPEYRDRILIRRNVKMTRRIDSLLHIRTMFVGIGAAHLPGDSGVIDLLRNAGYLVEPVMSSKKIPGSSYKFEEVKTPWVTVKDENEMYEVQMPANPASVKLYSVVDVKFHLDLFNLSSYSTMMSVYPGANLNKDSVINSLVKNMFPKTKVKPERSIKVGNATGYEYIQKQDKGHIRIQYLIDDNKLYMVLMTAMKKEPLISEDANRYFSSFKINEAAVVNSARLTYRFTDSIMGVSMQTASAIKPNKAASKEENGWKISALTGIDPQKGTYVMLFSHEIQPGSYITNDSILYGEIYSRLSLQYNSIDTFSTRSKGARLLHLKGFNKQQPAIGIRSIQAVRDNKNIIMMVIADTAYLETDEGKSIVNSFQLIDQKKSDWANRNDPFNAFTAWAPGTFKKLTKDSLSHQVVAYDTVTSTSYFVSPDTISRYYWVKTDTAYWNSLARAQTGSGSIVEQRSVSNDGVPGNEILIKTEGENSSWFRIRNLLNGNKAHQLFVAGSRESLNSPEVNRFFETFRLVKKIPASVTVSKSKMLLDDLGSEDSLIRAEAYNAIDKVDFAVGDLPLLHEALFKQYRDEYNADTTDDFNIALIDAIAKVNSGATIQFIENRYGNLSKVDNDQKALAIYQLAAMHTAESYTTLVKLIKQSLPDLSKQYGISGEFDDSLALLATIYPELLKFSKEDHFAPMLAYHGTSLLKDTLLQRSLFEPYEADFIAHADRLYLKLSDTAFREHYSISRLTNFLGELNSKAGNKFLRKQLIIKDLYYLYNVTELLVKNNEDVPADVFLRLATDPNYRLSLYELLEDQGKLSLYPKKFLNQAAFAEGMITVTASDEDEPSEIKYLSKRNVKFEEKPVTVYLYKVSYGTGSEKSSYLGVAGPFRSSVDLIGDQRLTRVFWQEEFDQKKISEQLNKILEGSDEEY
ncbi:MAG: TraB/GumN family protein [Chitinophagaceae bacterium]|nr:MAG: TraB/GumN family protein [Chitinophagaceae bacterium]